jgi:hypothetical protein
MNTSYKRVYQIHYYKANIMLEYRRQEGLLNMILELMIENFGQRIGELTTEYELMLATMKAEIQGELQKRDQRIFELEKRVVEMED